MFKFVYNLFTKIPLGKSMLTMVYILQYKSMVHLRLYHKVASLSSTSYPGHSKSCSLHSILYPRVSHLKQCHIGKHGHMIKRFFSLYISGFKLKLRCACIDKASSLLFQSSLLPYNTYGRVEEDCYLTLQLYWTLITSGLELTYSV